MNDNSLRRRDLYNSLIIRVSGLWVGPWSLHQRPASTQSGLDARRAADEGLRAGQRRQQRLRRLRRAFCCGFCVALQDLRLGFQDLKVSYTL